MRRSRGAVGERARVDEAGHLAERMDAGVGPPRDRELDRSPTIRSIADSTSAWTVRCPGWADQPAKREPS